MSVVQSNEVKRKPTARQLQIESDAVKRAWLLENVKRERLYFTYIRGTDEGLEDEDGDPQHNQFGGAVVCWKMPTRNNQRVIEVSISWCRDDEKFNKLYGRYYSAMQYINGNHTMFKLPLGPESVSDKLKSIFLDGFDI